MAVGIDFGTTNSAIAVAGPGRRPVLATYPDELTTVAMGLALSR